MVQFAPGTHIVFVISSLRMGGAERVASLLSNAWVEQGFSVSIITFDVPTHDFFELHPSIQRYSAGYFYSSKNKVFDLVKENILRTKNLRSLIKRIQPSVVVSFMDVPNILTLLATRGLGVPVYISERTYPPHFPRSAVHEFLRKRLYPYAAALVCQTRVVRTWACRFMPKKKVVVIPNPLDGASAHALAQRQTVHTPVSPLATHSTYQTVLAVGRLCTQKGFDRLIEAFVHVHKSHPKWKLVIVGEGSERPRLERLIKFHCLAHVVELRGALKEPFSVLADLFVMPSRVEGFPNALLEAMAHGLPCVSFDCHAGPSDIIEHNVNGLLVPEGHITRLASAISHFIEQPDVRYRCAQEARMRLVRYDVHKIASAWVETFPALR